MILPLLLLATMQGRLDTFSIATPSLSTPSRTIRVYLPAGYDAGRERYGVLYLQDAQNLFTPGAYGDWRVDEVVDSLVAARRIPPLIVVGIDNGPRRWDDYGPWTNREMFRWVDSSWSRASEGGAGEAYLDFLVHTLKPEIDRRYRTRPDRAHTAIGGSSMGGLISLWAGLTRPRVFSRVLAMSTAVWQAEGGGAWLSANQLLRELERRALPRDVRVYLDMGTEERSRASEPDVRDASGQPVSYPRAYVEGIDTVARTLQSRGLPPGNLQLVIEPGAVHNEAAWSRRLGPALVWLYH